VRQWNRADEGVWEVRGGRRHFVYSRFMSWVAIDRGLRLADKRSFPADRAKWLAARDAIYEEVMDKGWDPKRKAFVQAYGSDALDASALLMPLSFFVAPNDPRMLATVDAIRAPLSKGGLATDGLIYRYDPAASAGRAGGRRRPFNMCSFWLVEALTRAGRTDPRRLDDARLLFEQMLGYANHLGCTPSNRAERRGAGQLPAGVHALSPDQCRIQPRPGAGRRGRLTRVTIVALTHSASVGSPVGSESSFTGLAPPISGGIRPANWSLNQHLAVHDHPVPGKVQRKGYRPRSAGARK